jgi:prolyl-tRNA synthetase
VEPALVIKSLCYVAKGEPVLALVRGDQTLHEKKLARALGAEVRPAHPDEVKAHFGASVGSIGPVGAKGEILADQCLADGIYVTGANRDGFHLKGVRPARDFSARFVDLHAVQSGEACVQCGAPLGVERVIEVGNIFKLGTKYSVPLRAVFLDENGQERPIVMGSYGIGPARIVAAAAEQSHDNDGIIWPWSIAPYQVHLVPVNMRDQAQAETAENLYRELAGAGYEVLLDDRDERPGVKFKDADLVGIPIRVTAGTALVKEGIVEVRARRARVDRRVPPREVLATVRELSRELTRA